MVNSQGGYKASPTPSSITSVTITFPISLNSWHCDLGTARGSGATQQWVKSPAGPLTQALFNLYADGVNWISIGL